MHILVLGGCTRRHQARRDRGEPRDRAGNSGNRKDSRRSLMSCAGRRRRRWSVHHAWGVPTKISEVRGLQRRGRENSGRARRGEPTQTDVRRGGGMVVAPASANEKNTSVVGTVNAVRACLVCLSRGQGQSRKIIRVAVRRTFPVLQGVREIGQGLQPTLHSSSVFAHLAMLSTALWSE